MPNKLIQEIVAIDDVAEEMAISVLKNTQLRSDLEKKSQALEKRLLYLADELERIDPSAYETMANQVSEALLDLAFVQIDTDLISLRLNQVIEQQRSKDRDETKTTNTEKAGPGVTMFEHALKISDQNCAALRKVLDTLKKAD